MKFVSDRLKHFWKRVRDFCVFKILHADDPPHRLALGIAIGLFVTFLPLIGIQMLLAFGLAWLLRGNKLVGIPLVWISNPFTLWIYYPAYWLGCILLGQPGIDDRWSELKIEWATLESNPAVTWGERFGFWWRNLLEFVGPLTLGSLIVASVLGTLSYYIALLAIRRYRLKRWGQLMPPGLTPEEQEDEANQLPSKPNASNEGSKAGESAA